MCFLQNFTSTLPWATAKLHNLNRELQGQTHTLAEILCREVEGYIMNLEVGFKNVDI